MLSASSMVDLRTNVKTNEIFTVDLSDPPQVKSKRPEEKKEQKKPEPGKTEENKIRESLGLKEETVDLGTSDVKYVTYLIKIKKRILQIWEYPRSAYERNEEGVVVVKMSLDATGNLAGANLMSSSGSKILDEGALNIVRAAAPFDPLPGNYGLSRLHIIASFRYKLME